MTNSGAARQGTCRIFIAPKADERNIPLPYNQQRIYTIEMDKFTVNCKLFILDGLGNANLLNLTFFNSDGWREQNRSAI